MFASKKLPLFLALGLMTVAQVAKADDPKPPKVYDAEAGQGFSFYDPVSGGGKRQYGAEGQLNYEYRHEATSDYDTSGSFFLESVHGAVSDGKKATFLGRTAIGGTIGSAKSVANYQLDLKGIDADPRRIRYGTIESGIRFNHGDGGHTEILAAPVGGYSDLVNGVTGGATGASVQTKIRLAHGLVELRGHAGADVLWNLSNNGQSYNTYSEQSGTTCTSPKPGETDCTTTTTTSQATAHELAPKMSQIGAVLSYDATLGAKVRFGSGPLGQHMNLSAEASVDGRLGTLKATHLDGTSEKHALSDAAVKSMVFVNGAW